MLCTKIPVDKGNKLFSGDVFFKSKILCLLHLSKIIYIFNLFSVGVPPTTAAGAMPEIPKLEDISEEDEKILSAGGSKETVPPKSKLKVPRG